MRELPAVFELGDLTLDARQHALFRGTERIPLPRLTYELLLALAEAAPNLLTHEDLAERVWRGRLVSPQTLAQRVLLLRRALGDDARKPRYLRGQRGVGSQILVPLLASCRREKHPPPARRPDEDASAAADPSNAADIDLSLPAQPSIVVLPFDNADRDAEHENFARGLTHDVMTRIARTRMFFVIARGSAFRFAPTLRFEVRDVGRRLGVRYVVQGWVRRDRAGITVNVTLADAVEGREIWAERFHRRRDRVFEMQEEIAEQIVGAVSSEVDLAEQRRSLLALPANLDSWSAYHRGCWHMYRFTPADYDHAQRFFELSASLDPVSTRALAGLSFVHWQRAFLEISRDRAGEVGRAYELAQQSVALNPRDPLARWALGRAHLLRGEIRESVAELSDATALNPSFAVGQYTLGFALMHAGDTARAIELADRARRLSPYDPMSFAMIGLRGFSLALAGQYDQAVQLMATSIRQPNAHFHMVAMAAVCDALAGDTDAARRDLGRLLGARPGYGLEDFLRAFQVQHATHVDLITRAFRRLARLR